MNSPLLLVLLFGLVGSSLGRPNGDQEAAIAAADQELMAQESGAGSGARSLESFATGAELDKANHEPGPRFIKYQGMKCLMEEPAASTAVASNINKRSLKSTRRSAGGPAAAAVDSPTAGAASDTAANLFNMESLLSAISPAGSAGLNLEGVDLSGLGSLGYLGGPSGKPKSKAKNSLVRFNFMKRVLELIGLFVKAATDDKFLKDGNFLDFMKLCRDTLLGFDKLER